MLFLTNVTLKDYNDIGGAAVDEEKAAWTAVELLQFSAQSEIRKESQAQEEDDEDDEWAELEYAADDEGDEGGGGGGGGDVKKTKVKAWTSVYVGAFVRVHKTSSKINTFTKIRECFFRQHLSFDRHQMLTDLDQSKSVIEAMP